MRFRLTCTEPGKSTEIRHFYYDNATGLLHDQAGVSIGEARPDLWSNIPAFKADPVQAPIRKHNRPRVLKIQMGLSCNYSCAYCLQKHVPRAGDASLGLVSSFVEKVREHLQGQPENIQLWGGEPLVYIKTLRALVAELKVLYPRTKFTMITNGSLLNKATNDWIVENDIGVSMSHDGPGQRHRGPDPFDDPEKAEAIRDLYRRKKAAGDPMSIGAMIYTQNPDRAEVAAWLREKFQDPDIVIGEGAIIEVYDEGSREKSPRTHEERLMLRRLSLRNIRRRADHNFGVSRMRMDDWLNTMRHGRMLDSLGMKCGMDLADTLTVDLHGNVLTCQNTSIVSKAPNGEPHRAGSIDKLEEVKIRTSVHFMNREHCHGCPVVQACRGGCMYLTGTSFYDSCNNTYTDHIPYFAAAVEALTGYVLIYIEDDAGHLPEERKDIFGYGKPASAEGRSRLGAPAA